MYRAIPVVNKTCAERIRNRNRDIHKQKIKGMRSRVDTSVPSVASFDHLRNNLKREQILEDRYSEIDRENRILLQKMSDIMKQPTYFCTRAKSGPPSLNRDSRKLELMRITQENQGILKRIQQAQPVYNHVEWEDSFKKSTAYLKNAAEYPLTLSRKRPVGLTNSSVLQVKDGPPPVRAVEQLDQPADSVATPGGGSAERKEEALKYVLKEGKQLDQRYYLVEMATDGRTLAISAYDGDQQRTFELIVNERNHRRLYRDASGDYSAIASKLRVEGDQLVLDSGGAPYSSPTTPASLPATPTMY